MICEEIYKSLKQVSPYYRRQMGKLQWDLLLYNCCMQVTVFGAGGQVGKQVVALCLKRGYDVVVVVHHRNPYKIDGKNGAVTVVEADVHDKAAVTKAVQGSDAVISALGSWNTPKKDVLATAMKFIIPAMQAARIKRIVTVTGSGAVWEGDNVRLLDRLNRGVLKLIAPRILRDGEQHIALLAGSGLEWTVVRSPVMNNSAYKGYKLVNRLSAKPDMIARSAVATCLVDQIVVADFIGQAPVIHTI